MKKTFIVLSFSVLLGLPLQGRSFSDFLSSAGSGGKGASGPGITKDDWKDIKRTKRLLKKIERKVMNKELPEKRMEYYRLVFDSMRSEMNDPNGKYWKHVGELNWMIWEFNEAPRKEGHKSWKKWYRNETKSTDRKKRKSKSILDELHPIPQ